MTLYKKNENGYDKVEMPQEQAELVLKHYSHLFTVDESIANAVSRQEETPSEVNAKSDASAHIITEELLYSKPNSELVEIGKNVGLDLKFNRPKAELVNQILNKING